MIAVEPQRKAPLTEYQPAEDTILLQERSRPGEYMPAFEDEHGTYIMNSKDLRAIEHVDRLVRMRVDSLKIEGRTKSHFYVARTVQAYRRAIDRAAAGLPFDPDLLMQLDSLANRGYTEGFYRRHKPQHLQNYQTGNSISMRQQFVAEVVDFQPGDTHLVLEIKNHLEEGDLVELMTPSGNLFFTIGQMETLKGEPVTVAPGSGHVVKIPVPDPRDFRFGLMMKQISPATEG